MTEKVVAYEGTRWYVDPNGNHYAPLWTRVKSIDPVHGTSYYSSSRRTFREGNTRISYHFYSNGELVITTCPNYYNNTLPRKDRMTKGKTEKRTTIEDYLSSHKEPYVKVKSFIVYGPPGLDKGDQPEPSEPTPPGTPHTGKRVKSNPFGKFKATSSGFDVNVNYATHLRYEKGNDTVSRGRACLHLIRYHNDDSYEIVDTIFDVDKNIGDYWDEGDIVHFKKPYRDMVAGMYGFILELEDTYQDIQEIGARVNLDVVKYTTVPTKEYDGKSSYSFYIIDPKTGKQIPYEGSNPTFLQCHCGGLTECYRVVVPKGEEQVIRGDLFKGNIGTGGILGDGGSARLRNGVIKYDIVERIPPMFISTDESVGKIIEIPEVGWQDLDDKESEGEDGEQVDPFFWVDSITIDGYPIKPIPDDVYEKMKNSVTCYPKGVKVNTKLTEFDYDGNEKDWNETEKKENELLFYDANSNIEKLYNDNIIDLTIKNPLNEPIKVDTFIGMEDNTECGGGGFVNFFNVGWEVWGKGEHVGDGIEELPTYVKVAITELVSNHEIIGGCPGCYAEVLIKDGDNVLKTIKIDENGWTDFNTGNLYDYGLNEFDIEIKTYQEGYEDPRGYDVRCMFILDSFDMFTQYELAADPFNSMLDFYINDEKKLSLDDTGSGEHYFPVKKGKNKYKFVFTTDHWDYNWDYAEIPWIRLTNWICDDIPVVPYCEPGGGDKCIEALIGCVLELLPKKKGCVIIKHISYDTSEIMQQVQYDGYSRGDYTFNALTISDFEVVGDSSKTVFIDEVDKCTEVEFYYRRLYRDCVYVLHQDITTGNIILKENYPNLVPGEYIFSSKSFSKYKVVGEVSKTLNIEYLTTPPEECKLVVFKYDPIEDKDPYLDCVWVIHREKDNPNNVLATDHYYNLEPSKYKYYAKDFEGYEVVGDKEKEITIVEITDPVTKCKKIIFEYRKIKKGCVIVKFKDKVNNITLDTAYYYDLLPGEYSYNAKEFEGYKLVDDKVKAILVTEDDKECKEVTFLYEPLVKGCKVGKKIWLFT